MGTLTSNVYASRGKPYSNASPLQLVDPAAGDFRPLKNSDVLGAGESRYLADDRFIDLPPGMVLRDYCGNEIDLTGERIAAGACQVADPEKYGVKVDLETDNYNVSGCTPGEYVIASGASIRISRSANAIRHYGITVNGVTNLLDDGEYVYEPGTGIGEITSIVDPNWYVNPVIGEGDDANSGFTKASAKSTLAGVLSVATNVGDVVHAAAGEYGDLSMKYSDTQGIARAVISEGVTLVADDGPGATSILGASGTGSWDSGPGGMRCAMLHGNATLEGFTLAGGRSSIASGTTSSSTAYNGGGVWSDRDLTARVIGCVITNCSSYSGAAAFGVSLFDTVVKDNRAQYSAVIYCNLYGCLIGYNACQSVSAQNVYDVFDSTIRRPSRTGMPCLTLRSDVNLVNSVLVGSCTGGEWSSPPRNTVFGGSVSNVVPNAAIDCIFTDTAGLAIDDDYRPIVRSSVLCEAGNANLLPTDPVNAAILQKLRVHRPIMNGALDAGCYEADWRPCYTEDIAGRHLTIVAVTSNVVETAERAVRIFPGNTLTAEWPEGQGARKFYAIRFRIVGDGRLSVTMNGMEQVYEGAGEHEAKMLGTILDAAVAFSFSGDAGYADILSGESLNGFVISFK